MPASAQAPHAGHCSPLAQNSTAVCAADFGEASPTDKVLCPTQAHFPQSPPLLPMAQLSRHPAREGPLHSKIVSRPVPCKLQHLPICQHHLCM